MSEITIVSKPNGVEWTAEINVDGERYSWGVIRVRPPMPAYLINDLAWAREEWDRTGEWPSYATLVQALAKYNKIPILDIDGSPLGEYPAWALDDLVWAWEALKAAGHWPTQAEYDTAHPPPPPEPESTPVLTFRHFSRATKATWPLLAPLARAGDLFWGPISGANAVPIPRELRALSITRASLLTGQSDSFLANFCAVTLDGEFKDAALALGETRAIRLWIDAYNGRHPETRLAFHAYYPLNIYDSEVGDGLIVEGAEVLVFGKTNWQADGIGPDDPHVEVENLQDAAAPYLARITSAGKKASILCGAKYKYRDGAVEGEVQRSPADIQANMDAVAALGADHSYYFDLDNAGTLVQALEAFGRP